MPLQYCATGGLTKTFPKNEPSWYGKSVLVPQPIAPSLSSQIGMCTPEVLTCASKQADMRSWQVVPQVLVSHSGAVPTVPAKLYDVPPVSFLVMLWPDGSAHFTM